MPYYFESRAKFIYSQGLFAASGPNRHTLLQKSQSGDFSLLRGKARGDAIKERMLFVSRMMYKDKNKQQFAIFYGKAG